MEKNYLKLRDVQAYTRSFDLSNYVWDIVDKWDFFAKDTIGKQFVRSLDSISANLAEGFGRFGKNDKIKFFRYSRGSVYESLDWNEKAKRRKLISDEIYGHILSELKKLPMEINGFIKITRTKLSS